MQRNTNIFRSTDWLTVCFYLAMLFMGWISVYGASYDFANPTFWDFDQRASRQLLWVACSLVVAIVILVIDNKVYEIFAYFLYAAIILLLIVTIFVAPDIKGSHSWLVMGPLSIQPAELAKFATALAMAKYMSRYGFQLKGFKTYLNVLALFFLPMLCVVLQQEVGTALVFFAFFLVLYREGMSGVILYAAFCCITLFIFMIRLGAVPIQGGDLSLGSMGMLFSCVLIIVSMFAFALVYGGDDKDKQLKLALQIFSALTVLSLGVNWFYRINFVYIALLYMAAAVVYLLMLAFRYQRMLYLYIALFVVGAAGYSYSADYIFDNMLERHQQTRIEVALGMENDLKGSYYNINQSKIAIGSGQLWGKGFLNGTQTKLKYVPEQDTDFIFCTVGEEYGLWGASLVLSIYLVFMMRLVHMAERQRKTFSRIYGYCVASIFFFHFVVNIGMVLGITPVIGIPLPFFSYGGSSLLGFTCLLFIFVRLDAARLSEAN